MKYTLMLMSVVLATTYCTLAQDSSGTETNKSGLYALAGFTSATISIPANSLVQSAQPIYTMKSGLLADLKLSKRLAIVTGINISPYGAKVISVTNLADSIKVFDTGKFTPTFLQLPLMLTANFQLAKNVRFYIGMGPYISLGISGKSEREVSINGTKTTISRNIEFTANPVPVRSKDGLLFSQLNRLNYGICGQTGVEFKKYILALDMSSGIGPIVNLATKAAPTNTNRYQTLSVCIGRKL